MEKRESCQPIQKLWHVWGIRTAVHIELLLKPEEEENLPSHGQGRREGDEKGRFSGKLEFVSFILPSSASPQPVCVCCGRQGQALSVRFLPRRT